MDYKPNDGSTAFKVIEFLTTHPGEELTSEDVGAKYDKPSKNVHSLLGAAVLAGALVRAENDDGDIVYRLGTGVAQIKANPAGAPSLRTTSPFVGKLPPPPAYRQRALAARSGCCGDRIGRCTTDYAQQRGNRLAIPIQANVSRSVLSAAGPSQVNPQQGVHRFQKVWSRRAVITPARRTAAALVAREVSAVQ